MRSCYQTCVFAFGLAVSSLVGVLFVDCTAAEPRVPWTATTLRGSPDPPLEYRAERIFPGLEFDRPVTALQLPGRDRILVLEVGGDLLTFACDIVGSVPRRERRCASCQEVLGVGRRSALSDSLPCAGM